MFSFNKKKNKGDKQKDDQLRIPNISTNYIRSESIQSGTNMQTQCTIITSKSEVFSSSSSSSGFPMLASNSSLQNLPGASGFTQNIFTDFDATPFKKTNPAYQSLPQRKISLPSASMTNLPTNFNSNYSSPYGGQQFDAKPLPATSKIYTTNSPQMRSPNKSFNRLPDIPARGKLGIFPSPSFAQSSFTPQFTTNRVNSNIENELKNKLQIKVVRSNKFHDDPQSKVPMYLIRSRNRGKLLLINNMKFIHDNVKERKGAQLDESNIEDLFNQMGFSIKKFRDLTTIQMEKRIQEFRSDKSLKNVDICTVVVMSHGTGDTRSDSTVVIGTDGKSLDTAWIIDQFDGEICPYMANKPKIFLFQCCRGDDRDESSVKTDSIRIKQQVRKMADMLVAYSTVPGFVSHRDEKLGTWYIQAVCKIFMEHAHDTDVESLLKMVDFELSNLITTSGSKQTTSFENRSFKTCYLHPQYYEP